MMQLLSCNLAALAIATLYYMWRDYYLVYMQRERQIRERVAYMLWTAANRMG